MLCPKCGKTINDDDVFCAYCGETISQTQPAQAPVPVPPYVQTPVPPPVQPPVPPVNYGQHYPQPAPSGRPPKNGGKGPLIAVSVLAALLAAALIALIIILVRKSDKNDDSSSAGTAMTVNTEAETSTEPEATANSSTTAAETETEPDVTTASEITTAPETTAEPTKPETEPVTTEPQGGLSDDTAAQNEALFYSTRNRPTFAEFEWCAGQYGLVTEPSPNAETINNYLATGGGWKAMIIYEDTTGIGPTRELDNFEIFFDGNRVTLAIDWYYAEPPYSEAYYYEDADITQFTGSVNGSTIHTSVEISGDIVTIDLYSFWREDGRQYGLGTLYLPDGSINYIALVRK